MLGVLTPAIEYDQVRSVVAAQGVRIYTPPIDADDESADLARALVDAMPFSIIGSTEDVKTPDGRTVKGREYLWGVAEGMLLLHSVSRFGNWICLT